MNFEATNTHFENTNKFSKHDEDHIPGPEEEEAKSPDYMEVEKEEKSADFGDVEEGGQDLGEKKVLFPQLEVIFLKDFTGKQDVLQAVLDIYKAPCFDLASVEEEILRRGPNRTEELLVVNGKPTEQQFAHLASLAFCSMTVEVVNSSADPVDDAENVRLRRVYLDANASISDTVHALRVAIDNPHLDILEVR